jgi:hypothetical protein
MVLSPEAEVALSAGDHGLNRDPIPPRDPGNGFPDLDHLSGQFMADGHGKRGQGMFPLVDVEVSSADGAGFDAKEDVMVSHGRE